MPNKRTNDSVDEILQELDRRQTAQSVQGGMTDRQVDDILRSMGMYEQPAPAGAELGPIAPGDLPNVEVGADVPDSEEQRFSTVMLDDLLKDLPSVQAMRPARPQPAPEKQPAPVQSRPAAKQQPAGAVRPAAAPVQPAVQRQPAAPQPVTPQPAVPQGPARQPETDAGGLGDTTRSGIIKNFLRKMAPDAADASQGALNEGKEEFQRFFGESAAVVPDEKGHMSASGKKKRGLFGLGSVEDSNEFVPINVSLTGSRTGAPADEQPEVPGLEELYPEQPAPKKKGLFARLFGARETGEEELYIPESREPEQPARPHRGVVLEEDEQAGEAAAPVSQQLSMQLPVENIRSRYTAGRGQGLDMPPELPILQEEASEWPAEEQPIAPAPYADAAGPLPTEPEPFYDALGDGLGDDLGLPDTGAPAGRTGELVLPPLAQEDPLEGLLPGTSTLEFLQQQGFGLPAQPSSPAPGGVYRKKRTTVEFTPGQAARQTPKPEPYHAPGPVGEPVMTDAAAPSAAEPAVPEEGAPTPSSAAGSGFTMEIGDVPRAEDTQFFLEAYGQARDMHRRADKAPETVPQAAGAAVPDAQPRQAAGPVASQFVQNIEQAIREQDGTPAAEPAQPEQRFMEAAQLLADPGSEMPPADTQAATAPLHLGGTPRDEQTESPTSPFIAAPHTAQHSYDKPEDAPAVRADLARQAMVLGVSTIIDAVLALVLIYLGIAALGGGSLLPPPLALAAGKTPLLATMLVLLAVACLCSWHTILWGLAGLARTPSPDSMPALAAVASVVQLVVFLIWPDLYDPNKFCLVGGAAALLLCANMAGKALDARTLLNSFTLVSAKTEHVVARRLLESSLLQAAARGLAEPRPCVLISRPTELFKGFLTAANARRPSDKNQQQLARGLCVCALLSLVFTLVYHRDGGKAVTAFAAVFCLGAPLAGTLLSALPAYLMQRSAARVGAVIPGWHDIRQLGRINVIHLTTHDLFPEGSVRLCGIKPAHKEQIDRAIIYAASLLAQGCQNMQSVFLGMIGGDRKLLAKVDDFEAVYGKGYIGWIEGERVLAGNRSLMEAYGVKIPSLEYEQRHTVNQRRFIYLAVSGKLFAVFQLAYQRDPDTAAVLEGLHRNGMSLVVDGEDFNCDAALLEAVYALPAGAVKVLTAEEREMLEPATAWLPESSGNMLHLGSFASFVGGLQAAAGAAEGERRGSMVLTASVLLSALLALVMSVPAMGITALPLLALILYQVAWAVLALIFPMIQRY